jgi:hypothetical protein
VCMRYPVLSLCINLCGESLTGPHTLTLYLKS